LRTMWESFGMYSITSLASRSPAARWSWREAGRHDQVNGAAAAAAAAAAARCKAQSSGKGGEAEGEAEDVTEKDTKDSKDGELALGDVNFPIVAAEYEPEYSPVGVVVVVAVAAAAAAAAGVVVVVT